MSQQSLLVYDGDCRFCRSWVQYWSGLTGDQVAYRPYQQVAADFPQLEERQFRQHIQYFDATGQRHQGAAAAFLVLQHIPGKGGWWLLYRRLPGFAAIGEWLYDRVAEHRQLAFSVQKLLWGEPIYPDRYRCVSWLFLRLLALVYLSAFLSFYVQAAGLIGDNGLLPLQDFLAGARQQLGDSVLWQLPTLFWWRASDAAIEMLCLAGAATSLLLLVNRWATACLIFLYLAYLSLFHAGQEFMHYQWDLLLLETGFLAVFLGQGRMTVVWLFRFLLFRFVFLSGAVKLLSGDPSWSGLDALHYHFETQPLPTPLAWYAHRLPDSLLQSMTLATLLIELLLPFLYFFPRRPRMLAAWGLILLQLGILLTGNYNFFNLLTLALCLFLFDDRALRWLQPPIRQPSADPGRVGLRKSFALLCLLLFTLGIVQLWLTLGGNAAPAVVHRIARVIEPWHWVNRYGLFAVMTTRRPEIIIEGSEDGNTWRAYELPFKPGQLDRAPRWNIPHQPRLDWQLWFAALDSANPPPWLRSLMVHLLFNTPEVTSLLRTNPFLREAPRFVRARLFLYRFSEPQKKNASGDWWQRQELGIYYGPLYLQIDVQPLAPQP